MTLRVFRNWIRDSIRNFNTAWTDPRTGYIDVLTEESTRLLSQEHDWSFLKRYNDISIADNDQFVLVPGEPIDPVDKVTIQTTTTDRRDPLIFLDNNTFDLYYTPSTTAGNKGRPVHFTVRMAAGGDPEALRYRAYLGPTSDAAYVLNWRCRHYLPFPTGDNETNHWLQNHSLLVFHYVMMHARTMNDDYEKADYHRDLVYGRPGRMGLLPAAVALDNQRQFATIDGLHPMMDADDLPIESPTILNIWGRGNY